MHVGGGGGGTVSGKLTTAQAAALKKYNEAAKGTRVAGVDSGARIERPKDTKSDEFVAFRTAHPHVAVPNLGKRAACWDFCHPQGYSRKGGCAFAHPH